MFASNSRHLAAASLLCLISLLSTPAGAQITVGGDAGEVSPADPSTWTTDTTGHVGRDVGKTGTITVAGGSDLSSFFAYVGDGSGCSGTVTVTDLGSTWTNTGALYLDGTSSVTVANAGRVSSGLGFVGFSAGSSGTITVTGTSSVWTDTGYLFVGENGSGGLRAESGGKIYTTTAGKSCYLGDKAGSNGSVIITGTNSAWINTNELHVGYNGSGDLRAENGGRITSSRCFLGTNADSSGTASITGANSTWNNTGDLYVGGGGTGTLTVESGGTVTTGMLSTRASYLKGNGTINTKTLYTDMSLVFDANHPVGRVSFGTGGTLNMNVGGTGNLCVGNLLVSDGAKLISAMGSVGYGAGSSGSALITGPGSTWTTDSLGLGSGNTLTVANGGKVTAQSVNTGGASTVNLQVSGDGMLVLGNAAAAGSIRNSGKVNLYADAFLAAKTYSPITELQGRAITWTGTGSYNAYGGAWNGDKTFTVAAAITSGAGASNSLTTGERLLISDSTAGKRVGASFGTIAGGTNFSAAVLSGADLIGLPADQSVLGAWNFTTNFSGDQALLSFDIGAGRTGTLSVWHYDGSTWTAFAAPDLTYGADGIANFAVTGFSGYAITAAVPEPCSLALLVCSGMALTRRRNR